MTKKYAPRAHGNHNPQHGGQFFMASDNWHHLEGTYLPTGVFRMHLYDDYTKPLAVDRTCETIKATRRREGSRRRQGDDDAAGAERPRTCRRAIGKLPLPAQMYAKVKFKADGPDNRFDFTFDGVLEGAARGADAADARPQRRRRSPAPRTARRRRRPPRRRR